MYDDEICKHIFLQSGADRRAHYDFKDPRAKILSLVVPSTSFLSKMIKNNRVKRGGF